MLEHVSSGGCPPAASRHPPPSPETRSSVPVPPGRAGIVSPIVHAPAVLRGQLKRLALDRGITLHVLCEEAFRPGGRCNDLDALTDHEFRSLVTVARRLYRDRWARGVAGPAEQLAVFGSG